MWHSEKHITSHFSSWLDKNKNKNTSIFVRHMTVCTSHDRLWVLSLWANGKELSKQCLVLVASFSFTSEPPHDKTNKMACAPSENSDQPGHPPSLIRVFGVRMKKAWVLSYSLSAQRRIWSDWADAQADLNLHWAHRHFVAFAMRWLTSYKVTWHIKLA